METIHLISDPAKAQEDLKRALDHLAKRKQEEAQRARIAALEEDMRRHPLEYPSSDAYRETMAAVRRLCDD